MESSAVAALTAAFEGAVVPFTTGPKGHHEVVVTAWPTVPLELVRAAGFRPVVVRGSSNATPAANPHLEPGIFPSRIRHLVDAALTGRLADVAWIVVPRTSEADYKCFLYLREFVRRGLASALAPTVLFDLLQSPGEGVRAYGAGRTRALLDELASASHRRPGDDDIREQIGQANIARTAARRLAALRGGTPRVSGAEVFPLLGAFWQMAPQQYAALANTAADDLTTRPPLGGPRVLLTGAPVDTPALHAAIESHGAVVVAEPGPWGNPSLADVPIDADPMQALADAYRTQALGARSPVDAVWRWTDGWLDDVDAVVVSLPPDDTVFGWDYPALRDRLSARQLPHTCLRGDPVTPLDPAAHAQLHQLVARAARVHEARHG